MSKTKTVKPKAKVVKTKATRKVSAKRPFSSKSVKKSFKKKAVKKIVEKPITDAQQLAEYQALIAPATPINKDWVDDIRETLASVPESTPAPIPVQLNVTTTAEQQAGIPKVITTDQIEGVRDISKLPLEDQINRVFNPLHAITKTAMPGNVSEATFVVKETKNP